MNPKARILVIDDEEGMRNMLSLTLEQQGYTVLTAQNGTEGIRKITEEDIDVVITDMKMPGMDGITVLEKIKGIKPEVEVIMSTGYGTMETALESWRKGACDFITKPFDINELSVILKRALETKRIKSQEDFLSTISRELKAPLTAISGVVDLLMDSEGVNKELLEEIKKQTEKISNLVDNISAKPS